MRYIAKVINPFKKKSILDYFLKLHNHFLSNNFALIKLVSGYEYSRAGGDRTG